MNTKSSQTDTRVQTSLSHGFVRVAVVSPETRVADVHFNVAQIKTALEELDQQAVAVAVFPELSLTGYCCGDLFHNQALRQAAREGLDELAQATRASTCSIIVGLPWEDQGRLYNCAAFLSGGKVVGLVPKSYLPNSGEYYEKRWFTSGFDFPGRFVRHQSKRLPCGTHLLFCAQDHPSLVIGLELCEDLWAVEPPSGRLALAGATVIANLSASNETLGKADYRRQLVLSQSARCLAGYLYASCGPGESSAETVYSGHTMIAEAGVLLAEGQRFEFETQITAIELDTQRLVQERLRNSSFSTALTAPHSPESDSSQTMAKKTGYRRLPFVLGAREERPLHRQFSPTPFIPPQGQQRSEHCQEIFAIQTTGLAKRLRHLGGARPVLGLSGGLDSTLALLVTTRTMDRLGLDRAKILAVTMPGFGTTTRTRGNAEKLADLLRVELRTIPIDSAVRQHFADIGHAESIQDIVYENAQARERTQILMDLANQVGGLVVGTGDLSEAALGWCTFNGDQMSMYHVNSGVPKTLVRHLVEWAAQQEFTGEVAEVLRDIVATPISPELLPPDENGELQQKTEETVGPYELHDFFLYYLVRHGFDPAKILFLAQTAFAGRYSEETLSKWLHVFVRRFSQAQFKRSSMPDGPKVGSVALSPRADWRMPSDAEVLRFCAPG